MTWTEIFFLVIIGKTSSIVFYCIPSGFQLVIYQRGTSLKYDGDIHVHRVRGCSGILKSRAYQVGALEENDPCKS